MEKIVKDIMVPVSKYPTISAACNVKEALDVLRKAMEVGSHQANTSLYVMDGQTLVGVLGLREIIKSVDPIVFKEGTYRGWTVSDEWKQPLYLRGLFTEKYSEISAQNIIEIMRPATQSLSLNDSLLKALHALLANGFEALPVVQDGRVTGMVGFMEIISEISAIGQSHPDTGTVETQAAS